MQNTITVALSRLVAQERALDVSANNLANAGTPGYRAERMMFSDWLLREPAGSGRAETIAYTQDRATYRDLRQGTLTHTANALDLALGSEGFFTVQTQAGPRLTRARHFGISADGAVADEAGNKLLDNAGRPIQLSPADTDLSVASDGTLAGPNGPVARIGVVQAADPLKLLNEGSRLLNAQGTTTSAVTDPQVQQGAIEDSNVQPTMEVTRMIDTMRQFQMVANFVQAENDRQASAIDKIIQKRN
jgi:flagellar basal-body rod protein FlgF